MILKREPAWWAAVLSALFMTISAFFLHLSPEAQGAVSALILAILGFVVALMTHDGWAAAALGLIKAIISVALAFGLHWSADQQAVVMSLLAAISAGYVRTQATAPVPPPAS